MATADIDAPADATAGPFISLNQARRLHWLKIDGNSLDLSTIHRWSSPRGVRGGIRLRTVFLGGRRVTTEKWVREFVERLSDEGPEEPSRRTRSPSQRERQIRNAEDETSDFR